MLRANFGNYSNGLIVTPGQPLNNSSTGVKIDRGAYLSRINQMPDSQDSPRASVVFQLELRQVHVPCKLMPNGGSAMSVQKCRHYPSRVVRIAVKSNYKLIILCHGFCTREGCARLRQSLILWLFSRRKGDRENRSMFDKKPEKRRRLCFFCFVVLLSISHRGKIRGA